MEVLDEEILSVTWSDVLILRAVYLSHDPRISACGTVQAPGSCVPGTIAAPVALVSRL